MPETICIAPAGRGLGTYVVANAATVGTLYMMQALTSQNAIDFAGSPAVRWMQGATLAGYALGVALSAFFSRDLTSPRGLADHLLWLVASLCLAAWAGTALIGAAACVAVGLGCSLTQRLLVSATSAAPAEQRTRAIGWIIAGGLCGIVLARAGLPPLAEALGRRALLLSDACLIAVAGCACLRSAETFGHPPSQHAVAVMTTVSESWRNEPTLRRAALQQAIVFAAYNFGWARYSQMLSAEPGSAGLQAGLVASLGAAAALLSGSLCASRAPAAIARGGFLAVVFAGMLPMVISSMQHGMSVCMGLLDIGTQTTLVANQARAQSAASSSAMRGRFAAIVTTIGFLGGAVGAVLGNVLD